LRDVLAIMSRVAVGSPLSAYFAPGGSRSGGPPPPPADPNERPGEASGLFVLIVDDVEDSRFIYEHYFSFVGVKTATAPDGAAALAAIEAHRPDAIVLDLAMPKMTGWEVLERLRADPRTRTIPVLVLSGQMERESAIRAGADAYCSKPCPPDEVLRQVQRLVARKRQP
jgi:CheY-like chemotaxis protein